MLVIDTHIWIWMALDPAKLSKRAFEALRTARADATIVVADISVWELAWFIGHQRINVFTPVEKFLASATSMVVVEPITAEIARLAVQLPRTFPRDPINRLIAATAISCNLPLVTADDAIRKSQVVQTVW